MYKSVSRPVDVLPKERFAIPNFSFEEQGTRAASSNVSKSTSRCEFHGIIEAPKATLSHTSPARAGRIHRCRRVDARLRRVRGIPKFNAGTGKSGEQARRFSFAGAKVQICQALDGRVSFYYGDTRLEHSAIQVA